jgi:hypothetical protein
VILPIAIMLIAFGPSVISFIVHMFQPSKTVSTSPTFSTSSGSGGFTFAPTPSPTIPPAGGLITLTGNSVSETVACNQSIVVVTGSSSTHTITGHCASVTVSGDDNVVNVDSVDTITAGGSGNKVTYRSGTPQVNNPPVGGNVVELG